jgi:hypothetical protein
VKINGKHQYLGILYIRNEEKLKINLIGGNNILTTPTFGLRFTKIKPMMYMVIISDSIACLVKLSPENKSVL